MTKRARLMAHRLKYGDRLDLASTLASWMARAGAELLRGADLIVPVPMHRRRIWTRRFNQAALLADGIGRRSGKRVDPFVWTRERPTRPQVGLSRAERQANLSGAFEVQEEAKGRRGLRVLLVDDVLTTGATANAASRALLRGGATAVDVLVFAKSCTMVLCMTVLRLHEVRISVGVRPRLKMREVMIYTKAWCPYCSEAKALLDRKGVDFTEIEIDREPQRRLEMLERRRPSHRAASVHRRDACRGLR